MAKSKIPNEIFLINQLHIFNDIAFLNKICSSENRKGLIVLLLLEFFPCCLNEFLSFKLFDPFYFLFNTFSRYRNERWNLNLRSRKRRIKKKSARSKCVFPRDNFSLVLCTKSVWQRQISFVLNKRRSNEEGGESVQTRAVSIMQ